jgi:predicted lipid carrier protein YhbT
MSAEFLSDDWFALLLAEGGALPEVTGTSLVMQHVVAGAPQAKKLQAVVEVRDGKVVVAEVGKRPDATCTVTWDYKDAVATLRGDLDVDVAFMRGDLTVDGDYVTFLFGLRQVLSADGAAPMLAAVRAGTAS